MSDAGRKESQPLLGESNVTVTGGGGIQGKTVAWVVAMIGVGVVIVLLIALPLTLVQRPPALTNGTSDLANGTTEIPAPDTTTTELLTDAPADDVITDAPVDAVTQVLQAAAAGDSQISFK